jgi:hypothetical protein
MGARETTFTPWETRIGVKVECWDCDFMALRAASSSAIKVARGHVEDTGHAVNITKVLHRTASAGELRGEEPNPHVQRTWTPEGVA